MRLHLRTYAPDDFDTLCDIDKACYEPVIAYSRREMRAYLNAPGAECVIAESAAEIAGFCITAHQEGQAYIITIDVLDAYRRHGVGTALLAECEKRLIKQRVRVIALDTATDNVSAIAFWQKHGYRKLGVRKRYYPNGRDAFAMTKSIAP